MSKRTAAPAVIAIAAMALSACGTGEQKASESGPTHTVVVGVDLAFQGSSKETNDATLAAMQLYLDQVGGKAGQVKVELKKYDNSTAAKGSWDSNACIKNAQDHVANAAEVAVMGPYNSGCAKAQAPIMAADATGPMLLLSHAATNPGLTKAWEQGEPEKYQPGGKKAFARVITTDDYQGTAAARFAAKDLGVQKCFVLNDTETYGKGIARVFTDEARKQGIALVGEASWEAKQVTYTALFDKVKAAGADCVYLAGVVDNNGVQLVKDKVKVLGDNTAVKLLAPDGFTGRPDLDALPEAQGMHLTFAGLAAEQLQAAGGKGTQFFDAYQAKYGKELGSNSYAVYAVQALQVILAAIAASDGTRKGVHAAVMSGAGLTVPAAQALLGKDVHVDPATGDVTARDISVLVMKDKKESFLKAWPVS